MMRTVLLALAMGATAIGGVAYAAQTPTPDAPPPPPGGRPMGGGPLMRADLNHDGVVTRDEFLASEGQRFDAMDTDHDGTVTPAERAAYRDAMRDRRIADGGQPPRGGPDAPPPGGPSGPGARSLTREQAMTHAAARFDRMDTNHDGKLDRTEIANIREMRHLDRREQHDATTPPPPPPGE